MAYAHLALGEHDAAVDMFEKAVASARERSAPYEIALGLDGLIAAAEARGESLDAAVARERDEIFAGLGVRATFRPMPSRDQESDPTLA